MRKRYLGVALIVALVSTGFKCGDGSAAENKARDIALARDVVTAFRSALPLVRELKPQVATIIERAIPIAENVVNAIERSDATNAVSLLRELLPLVNEVVGQFTGNVKVLTILAIADIALHFLINHYQPEIKKAIAIRAIAEKQGVKVSVDPIVEFSRKPVWGCEYRPDLACPSN